MVSDVITRTHGKDRVIDFRDGLVPSTPEEYASMHQAGGRKNANTYPSVIKMFLCDFSRGTGDKSVTVSVNLDPTLCYEWLDICKKSLGSVVLPYYEKAASTGGQAGNSSLAPNALFRIREDLAAAGSLHRGFIALLKNLMVYMSAVVRGQIVHGSAETFTSVGGAIKNAKQTAMPQQIQEKTLLVPCGTDYSYQQDKVNVYRRGQDGYAPVSRLQVTRQSFRPDGDAASYPWTFKITNGEALVQERSNGATTFRSDTIRNKTEAYILVSDRDMYRMMTRVTRFIDAWEKTCCIPVLRNGIQQREQERQQAAQDQQGYYQ